MFRSVSNDVLLFFLSAEPFNAANDWLSRLLDLVCISSNELLHITRPRLSLVAGYESQTLVKMNARTNTREISYEKNCPYCNVAVICDVRCAAFLRNH
uniref:Putative secreted protein n=1 Tax=Ixodes ricinus TaxID=34613 RepID=A0A6B0UFV6_IXORI